MANCLNKAFGRVLVFPLELATRLLTHASHPSLRFVGHNGRFAFTGEFSTRFFHPRRPYIPFSMCESEFEEDASNPVNLNLTVAESSIRIS